MNKEESKLFSLLKKQDIDSLFLEATNYLCQTKSLFKEKEKLQQENEQLSREKDIWNKKYNEVFNKNKQLKDNWNKLKDFIVKEYYMYLPLEASVRSITILIDKMQELERNDNKW